MKNSYMLVLNEGYVKDNVYTRTLKKEEVQDITLSTIDGSDYLFYEEKKPKTLSLFKTGLNNPKYRKFTFKELIPLLLYIQKNNLDFHLDSVGSGNDYRDLNIELKSYYLPKWLEAKEMNNEEAFEDLINEFDDEYGFNYYTSMYISVFHPVIKGDNKKMINFKIYQSSVIYSDTYNSVDFLDEIEKQVFEFYKLLLGFELKTKSVELPLKTVVNHPYAHISDMVVEMIDLVEKEDEKALLVFLKEHQKDLKLIQQGFNSYKGKTKEI